MLTGAAGLLGRHIGPILSHHAEVVRVGFRRDTEALEFALDLSNREAAWHLLDAVKPDIVVHTVALTDVDRCQSEASLAYLTNVETTRHIADWIAQHSPATRYVYLSTDQVYCGTGGHTEDRVAPLNVYGLTKLWGEDVARRTADVLVLRTNFFALGAGARRGLAGWLIDSLERGEDITVFEDIYFNPLYAADLGDLLVELLQAGLSGTYNLAARGGSVSKADFAEMLADELSLNFSTARRGRSPATERAAPRPRDMTMSVARIEERLGRPMPTVRHGIQRLGRDRLHAAPSLERS